MPNRKSKLEEAVDRSITGRKAREAGKRWQRKCQQFLESLGWGVIPAKPSYRRYPKKVGNNTIWLFRAVSEDHLGFGDLLAFHPERTYTVWVQAHLGTHINERKAKGEALRVHPATNRLMIWRRGELRATPLQIWRYNSSLGGEFRWVLREYPMKNGNPIACLS